MVGIIVSGGANNQVLKSVEIIREDGTICTLPDMQVNRGSHTQSGWVICGGADDAAQNTCTTFEDGAWVESHDLSKGRKDHLSWRTSTGDIILLGGSSAQTWQSTELLSDTASANTQPFPLKYNTRYQHKNNYTDADNYISKMCRKACGIAVPETDHIVITGGQMGNSNKGTNWVHVYNTFGEVSPTTFPNLKQSRFQHACGFYYDNLGQIVSNVMSEHLY